MSKLLGGILAALLCTCSFCSAQELTVAAASDLQFVLTGDHGSISEDNRAQR
jgi:hypothetical protein